MPFNSSQLKLSLTNDRIKEALINNTPLNPNPTNNLKWPCSVCNKNVLRNQKAIQCDLCDKWCHITCDGTSPKTYNDLTTNELDNSCWYCLWCVVKISL